MCACVRACLCVRMCMCVLMCIKATYKLMSTVCCECLCKYINPIKEKYSLIVCVPLYKICRMRHYVVGQGR